MSELGENVPSLEELKSIAPRLEASPPDEENYEAPALSENANMGLLRNASRLAVENDKLFRQILANARTMQDNLEAAYDMQISADIVGGQIKNILHTKGVYRRNGRYVRGVLGEIEHAQAAKKE